MLRGMCTITLWSADLPSATRWYTALLGLEPYFTSEAVGAGPGYVEFRVGEQQDELGIADRRFAPPGFEPGRGGALTYWHVDDVAVALERLLGLGATLLAPMTDRGGGFVTAAVVDPFGNALGVMHNPRRARACGPA